MTCVENVVFFFSIFFLSLFFSHTLYLSLFCSLAFLHLFPTGEGFSDSGSLSSCTPSPNNLPITYDSPSVTKGDQQRPNSLPVISSLSSLVVNDLQRKLKLINDQVCSDYSTSTEDEGNHTQNDTHDSSSPSSSPSSLPQNSPLNKSSVPTSAPLSPLTSSRPSGDNKKQKIMENDDSGHYNDHDDNKTSTANSDDPSTRKSSLTDNDDNKPPAVSIANDDTCSPLQTTAENH
jgi:hypothetical protein